MSDNEAILNGWTRELMCSDGRGNEIHILVDPDIDLDTRFRAWECDNQEIVVINGGMCEFHQID